MKNSLSVWNVKDDKFPVNGRIDGQLKFLLHYAILAPSGHNSQPWKFKIQDSSVIISPDYTKARTEVDPNNREMFISLGAATRNIELAADHFGLMYDRKVDKDKIIIKFGGGKTVSKSTPLFKAITKRMTYRGDFFAKSIAKEKVDAIRKIEGNGAFIKVVEDKSTKKQIAGLISEADLVWFKSRNLVKELEGWLRDDVEMSKDGLPTAVLSLYKVAVELKYLFSGDSQYAIKRAKRDYEQSMRSPLLVVVATKTDVVEEWIQAGRMYETLALKLTSLGLGNGFFNVVVQLKKPRKDLAKILKINGVIQMLLRVGYPKEEPTRTQRLPVDDVLLKIR